MAVYMFPGQGSQKIGMGAHLFSIFPELVADADSILGYSIETLCLQDPQSVLNHTEYTQPALFVVNALSYLHFMQEGGAQPDFFIGHSLGEYNALCAAGCFDFQTGLRLVQERARLMGQMSDGAMAAVIGLSSDTVASILAEHQLDDVSIANFNSYQQQVISGAAGSIARAKDYFIQAKAKLYLPLAVNGAFHSPFMSRARIGFSLFLNQFQWQSPTVPVISNVCAKPHSVVDLSTALADQIERPVLWLQSMLYLLRCQQTDFKEFGFGTVLTHLLARIRDSK